MEQSLLLKKLNRIRMMIKQDYDDEDLLASLDELVAEVEQ